METFRVFVLDPYHPDAITTLQSAPGVELFLPNDPSMANWHESAHGLLLRSDTQLRAEDFARARQLRVVVKQGVGVDNIDLDAARQHGIRVHNTPALNSEAVAELALTLALGLARRIGEFDRRWRAGQPCVRSQMLGTSLYGKVVGVVGMGNIGKEVAKKFIGCANARIIGYDPVAPADAWRDVPHDRAADLSDLLRTADVVTLHVPLLESTRHMLSADQLAQMKPSAILLNTARGGIVEESALLKTLKDGHLWGAALDATVIEPPTAEAYSEWLELDNVIITPHVGASTRENQSNSGLAAVKTILAVLRGEKDAPGAVV